MGNKISIRFFDDREVRAVWNDTDKKWYFSVPDILGVLNDEDDYSKNRNYWKYLKTKLRKEGNEVVSVTNQLKLLAPDGKRRLTDVLDNNGVIKLAQSMPNTKSARFVEKGTVPFSTYVLYLLNLTPTIKYSGMYFMTSSLSSLVSSMVPQRRKTFESGSYQYAPKSARG